MDGLGVVAERFLGEPHGESTLSSTFGPAVAVAMQGYSVDAQTEAALMKFRGTVFGWNGAQVREEGAFGWALMEKLFNSFAELDDGGFNAGVRLVLELVSMVANGHVVPVDVLSMEVGQIGL